MGTLSRIVSEQTDYLYHQPMLYIKEGKEEALKRAIQKVKGTHAVKPMKDSYLRSHILEIMKIEEGAIYLYDDNFKAYAFDDFMTFLAPYVEDGQELVLITEDIDGTGESMRKYTFKNGQAYEAKIIKTWGEPKLMKLTNDIKKYQAKGKGWHKENHRHSMAVRGIKTR